jgi:bifunctional DNA-binding transcriptional regulator/antitoxin component of YhaV-PrlF toxin-antitoxin module
LVIFTGKTYENERGYFYIPVTWREEFNLYCGIGVGIDYKNNFLVIDRGTSREYTQKISAKGKLTIPLELREKIHSNKFYILIEQCEEKIILAPILE